MSHPFRRFDYHEPPFNEMIFERIPPKNRVLDIGCASGKLGEILKKKKGCVVEGIEQDPKLAQQASLVLDRVYQTDLDAGIFPEELGHFDVIVLADVLEHIQDPVIVLEKCRSWLAPKGKILISCPNIANWQVRLNLLFGKYDYDFALTMWGHVHQFTLRNIKKLIKHVGYQVISVAPRNDHIKLLGRLWPTLFAFQFIVEVIPHEA